MAKRIKSFETSIATPKNVHWINKNWEQLNFDLSVQRSGGRWTLEQKSDFIHSIVGGYYIPPVLTVDEDSEEFVFSFIDGKQRFQCIREYTNNVFALGESIPEWENHILAGKKFDELDDDVKNQIELWNPTIVVFKNISEDEIERQYVKTNSGAPFLEIELLWARIGSEMREYCTKIKDTPFFNKINFGKNDRALRSDVILVLQMIALTMKKRISFSMKDLKTLGVELRLMGGVPDENDQEMQNVLTYLDKAFRTKRSKKDKDNIDDDASAIKALKKVHIAGIFEIARWAIENEVDPELYGNAVLTFLKDQSDLKKAATQESKKAKEEDRQPTFTKGDYNEACDSSTAQKDSIDTRINELGTAVSKFVERVREYIIGQEETQESEQDQQQDLDMASGL